MAELEKSAKRQLPFSLYDAFSNSRYGGSQAAVISGAGIIGRDKGAGIIGRDKRAQIAREFGYPATAFVSGVDNHTVSAQFFSTVAELPMCGHGTMGLIIPGLVNTDPYNGPNSFADKARLVRHDTGHRSRDTTPDQVRGRLMFGGRIWATEGRHPEGFGQRLSLGLPLARPGDCASLVVPVPGRQSRLAKTLGNSGHMSQYLRNLVSYLVPVLPKHVDDAGEKQRVDRRFPDCDDIGHLQGDRSRQAVERSNCYVCQHHDRRLSYYRTLNASHQFAASAVRYLLAASSERPQSPPTF